MENNKNFIQTTIREFLNENFKSVENIQTTIREYLNEQQNDIILKLYHKLSNKTNMSLENFIKNIVSNGLIRHDNGEIGNVIWFSNNYEDYAKNGSFVVSIDFNNQNKEKYEIYYDNHNGYAYKDIPFKELSVIKIPVFVNNNRITDSLKMIELINKNIVTTEKINDLSNLTIYADIFNEYVQPYIVKDKFLKKIDTNNVNLKNII